MVLLPAEDSRAAKAKAKARASAKAQQQGTGNQELPQEKYLGLLSPPSPRSANFKGEPFTCTKQPGKGAHGPFGSFCWLVGCLAVGFGFRCLEGSGVELCRPKAAPRRPQDGQRVPRQPQSAKSPQQGQDSSKTGQYGSLTKTTSHNFRKQH